MRVRVELDCWIDVDADSPEEASSRAETKLLSSVPILDIDEVIGGRVVEIEEGS
jgi:hypothetical protein